MIGEWVMSDSHSAELVEAWKNGPISLTAYLTTEASLQIIVAVAKAWEDKRKVTMFDEPEGAPFCLILVGLIIVFPGYHEDDSF